jgi:hypothetical protein
MIKDLIKNLFGKEREEKREEQRIEEIWRDQKIEIIESKIIDLKESEKDKTQEEINIQELGKELDEPIDMYVYLSPPYSDYRLLWTRKLTNCELKEFGRISSYYSFYSGKIPSHEKFRVDLIKSQCFNGYYLSFITRVINPSRRQEVDYQVVLFIPSHIYENYQLDYEKTLIRIPRYKDLYNEMEKRKTHNIDIKPLKVRDIISQKKQNYSNLLLDKEEEKGKEGKEKEEIKIQVQEIQQAQEVKQAPETVEKRETIEDMKEKVCSDDLCDVERRIDGIEKKINEINSENQEIAKKIESCKKDIKELEESIFPNIQKEIDTYRERIKRLEENLRKQEENYKSQLASIGEVISKYAEISNKKIEYIKQITELKEMLGNLEREINRYERIGKIPEEKVDKIAGIIGKYLKTSRDYDENAQKIIEALDYDEEDLIAAYKLGRELGYSREQLKNIAAAIGLKNYRAWELTNKYKLTNIGEDPEGIKMYIAETAAKTSRKDLRERIIEEIFK